MTDDGMRTEELLDALRDREYQIIGVLPNNINLIMVFIAQFLFGGHDILAWSRGQ